jgi:hypothetical protein
MNSDGSTEPVAHATDGRGREPRRGEIVRNIMAVLLTGLLSAPTLVFASERPTGEPTALTPPAGPIMAAAIREGARLAPLDGVTGQVGGSPATKSDGHPVLISTVIGAGAGAIALARISCQPFSAEMLRIGMVAPPCSKTTWAVVGAAVGAGVGALIGLAFRH